jgi:hypothetical protein
MRLRRSSDLAPGDTAEAGAMAKKGSVAEFKRGLDAYLKKRGLNLRPYKPKKKGTA